MFKVWLDLKEERVMVAGRNLVTSILACLLQAWVHILFVYKISILTCWVFTCKLSEPGCTPQSRRPHAIPIWAKVNTQTWLSEILPDKTLSFPLTQSAGRMFPFGLKHTVLSGVQEQVVKPWPLFQYNSPSHFSLLHLEPFKSYIKLPNLYPIVAI